MDLRQVFAANLRRLHYAKGLSRCLSAEVSDGHGKYMAQFKNERDNRFACTSDDDDEHRVHMIVERARAINSSLKILVSLG